MLLQRQKQDGGAFVVSGTSLYRSWNTLEHTVNVDNRVKRITSDRTGAQGDRAVCHLINLRFIDIVLIRARLTASLTLDCPLDCLQITLRR